MKKNHLVEMNPEMIKNENHEIYFFLFVSIALFRLFTVIVVKLDDE
jgi:hypothetical protein